MKFNERSCSMSRGLNKFFCIGSLGSDPEVKYAANGTAICNVSIAINESRKKGGEWEDYTEWVKLIMFGKIAEAAKNYLHKGSKIHVEGKLQSSSWEGSDGTKKYKTEIVVLSLLMLDSKGGNDNSSQQKQTTRTQPVSSVDDESDLPF